MLFKIIILFFAFIAVLAMFGRVRMPGRLRGQGRDPDRLTARKCPKCGTFRIGRGPCPCEHRE